MWRPAPGSVFFPRIRLPRSTAKHTSTHTHTTPRAGASTAEPHHPLLLPPILSPQWVVQYVRGGGSVHVPRRCRRRRCHRPPRQPPAQRKRRTSEESRRRAEQGEESRRRRAQGGHKESRSTPRRSTAPPPNTLPPSPARHHSRGHNTWRPALGSVCLPDQLPGPTNRRHPTPQQGPAQHVQPSLLLRQRTVRRFHAIKGISLMPSQGIVAAAHGHLRPSGGTARKELAGRLFGRAVVTFL